MPFFLIFCLTLFMISCGNRVSNQEKPVLHLFSDAKIVHSQGLLSYPEDSSPLRSILTYPVYETLWVQDWQGKKSLRFESSEEGELRGSIYMMHEPFQETFHWTLKSWLDADAPETWNGMCFWMYKNNKQAVGARWSAKKSKGMIIVQIFKYDAPHVRSLVQRSYPFQESHWTDVSLTVENNLATLQIDGQEPFSCLLDPQWHIGDQFGLFQGQGTGFYTNIVLASGNEQRRIDDLFPDWNQEIYHTTRKTILDNTFTPDDFVGNQLPVRRIMIADDWRASVPVLCPSELSFQVSIPPNSTLHTGFGIVPAFSLSNTTAEFRIILRADNQDTILYSRELTPAQESLDLFRYHDLHLPLDEYAGQEVELIFQVLRKQGDDALVACWAEPTIGKRNPKNKPLNVLLILLDTLRADRVGVYGNPKGLTPYIDQFAQTGTTFLQTVSQAPWTVPSHASFFTGLYPSETGCDRSSTEGNVLQEGYITWAEYLQREGYSTAAFATGGAMRGFTNFTQGFDTYKDIVYDNAYSLESVYERFKKWQDAHSGEPWFVFLHTYAIHDPYKHEQYIDYRTIYRNWEDQRKYQHDVYDGGVRYADEYVGSVLRYLREKNLLDSTLVIITSDHGEALGDRWMPRPAHHGHTLYDELLMVPLILHLPGKIPAGKTVSQQVRLLDLLPTVLDVLDYPQPSFIHGLSLLPLMQGDSQRERYALSEGMTYGVAQKSLRTKDYKYIVVPEPKRILDIPPTGIPVPEPESVQLYDLLNDPFEKNSIALSHPEILHELQALYNLNLQLMISPELFQDRSNLVAPPNISARIMEELQKLGYVAK